MREIMQRWPCTLSLPIMPTGAIPLHGDLVRTSNGYMVAGSDNEAELVQMARTNTAAHVARNVAAMRQAERLSESKAAFDAYRHRTFTCHTDEDGTLVFEGRLPADQGALLIQALDRAMEWLGRGFDETPQTVRRADALAILAERFLSEPPAEGDGLNTADRFQITVHASAEALIERNRRRRRSAADRRRRLLATESLRRIACDGAIVRILETGDGEPLDIGRGDGEEIPAGRETPIAALMERAKSDGHRAGPQSLTRPRAEAYLHQLPKRSKQ